MNPNDFVDKWRNVKLKERSAVQEHFLDLCALVGHGSPAQEDPTGERFTFEAGASKQKGGQGWADVWKRGFFAWEYKGKHADLDKAYQQLLQYREALQNPALLIVSDIDRIIVHTNFTNTVKRVVPITLDDLLTTEGMRHLRAIFYEPEAFRTSQTTEQVTQDAARQFSRLAEYLRKRGENPERVAHFLIRLLFCLFAEDIELLPKALFSRLVDQGRRRPLAFTQQLRQLFNAMATGGFFGEHSIMHFNGGLFDNEDVIEMDRDGLDILYSVSMLDWANIEPSIFGTLFERSLDPDKRGQLGAHYTGKDDILLIVEPVLMGPLRRRWSEVQQETRILAQRRDEAKDRSAQSRVQNQLVRQIMDFANEVAIIRVLDPACGSANFLYVALKLLLDLEKEIINFCGEVGIQPFFPQVNPRQLYGIELNEYAHELAQATVWIGYIQWLHDNGYGTPSEPILKPLDNIRHMDAILSYDDQGTPVEPEWPEADVIIGNPPFLGGNKIRQELGSNYVNNLFSLYEERVPGFADLVCYWFERARAYIEKGTVKRAGLLATNSIRGGANRQVLERIKSTGNIFMAWGDRPWVLDGAAVRVSMIGFDKNIEQLYTLDGVSVSSINAGLSGGVDTTKAQRLQENANLAFVGDTKKGSFDIPNELAQEFIASPINPNGRSNKEVVRPWINGLDITHRPRNMWIIDFGVNLPEDEAALYEKPYEYVRKHVKPERDKVNNPRERILWWLHGRPAPDLRNAIKGLQQYIATARVAKYRLFTFQRSDTIPDGQVVIFARDDSYFLGILHSRPHEVWSLLMGTSLEDRPRYSQTMTFETFPFPWPPGKEPGDDPKVKAIAQAAKELVEKRDAWLNPAGLSDKDLQKRTLTNLYNARPTWLDLAHKKLDAAVFAAYGWPDTLSDEEILGRLLSLNLERSQGQ